MISIENKLQQAHKGYAYELLELQMAVQDEKLGCEPSILQITKLMQLYMLGVQVLESIGDRRFAYFRNKIHTLMTKKHIVKKLHQASGNKTQQSINTPNREELQGKKDEYEINFYFNQGQVDIKKVKQILNLAENKKLEAEGKIKTDIKKQQDRLEERIKERRLRFEAGSVKKFDPSKEIDSSVRKKQPNINARMEYFQKMQQSFMDSVPKNSNKIGRASSGSLQKILKRKYGRKPGINFTPGVDKRDFNDIV